SLGHRRPNRLGLGAHDSLLGVHCRGHVVVAATDLNGGLVMAELDVFETIYNCRAIRYFKADPVPDDLITKVLDAAIRAPSGSNRQAWHFLVVTDPAIKKTLQEYYKQAFDVYASMMAHVPPRPGVSQETQNRVVSSAVYLSEHL